MTELEKCFRCGGEISYQQPEGARAHYHKRWTDCLANLQSENAALRAQVAELEGEAIVGRGAIGATSTTNCEIPLLINGRSAWMVYSNVTGTPVWLLDTYDSLESEEAPTGEYTADTWQDCLRQAGLLPDKEGKGDE